uniref:Proteoglycan 4 isoform X6 n=1 Tax=Geotrypetes seraphini TaxID=260995 RepID=A0A6P8SEJ6_GEOSA|nr:proteoglycan 4 isoform X6 [Geotrypetes seraphini]
MSWPAYSVQLLFSIFFFLPEQCSTRDPSRCQGRCGDAFSRGDNCHCDYSCLYFMECCHDYRKACTSEGSCKGRCYEDFKRGRECDCDLNCMTYGHCCPDYHLHCKAPPENQTYTLTSSTTTSPPAWRRVTTRKPPHKTSRNMIRDKIRPEDVTQVAQEHLLPSLSHDNGNKPPKQRQPWTPKKRMRKVIYEDDTSEEAFGDPSPLPTLPPSFSPGSKITTNRSPWTPRKKIKKVIYEDDTTEEPFEDPSPSATSSSSPGSKITTKRSPQTPRKKIKKVIYEDGTIEEPFEDPSPSSPGSKIATKRSPQTPKKKIKKVIYEDGTTEEPFEDPSPSSPGSKIATKRSPQTPKKKIKKVIYEDGTTEEPFEDPSPSSPGSKIATKRSPQTPKKKIKKVIYEDGTTEEPFEDPSPSSPGSKIATKRSPQTPKKKIKKVIYEDGTTEEPFEDPSPSSPGSKIATKRSPQTPKKKIKKVIYEDGTTEEPEDGLLPLVYPSVLSPPPTHGSNIPRSPPPWTPKKRIRKVIYDDDTTEEPFTDLSPTPSFSPKPPGSKITIKRSPKTPRKKRINEDGATEDPSQNPLSSQSTPLVLPLPSQSSRTPKKRSPKSPKMKPRAGIYPTDTTQDPIRGPSSTSPQSSTSSDVKVTTKRSPKTPNRKKAKKAESSEEIRETSENEFHKKSRSSSSSETSQRRSKSTLRRKSKKQEDDNLKRKKLPKENHKATTISPSLPEKSTSSKDVKPDEDGSGMDFSEDNTIPPPEPSTTESSTIGTEGTTGTKYVSKDPNSGDISTPVTILTPTTGQEESSWLGNQNRTTIQEFYRTFNPTKPKEYKNATMRSALPETTTSLTTRPQQNRTTTSAPKLSSIHTTFNSITTDGNSTQRKSDSSHTTKSNPKDRPRNNSLVTSKSVDKGYLEETYTTHPAPVNNTRMPTVKGERTTSKGKRHQKKTATEPAEPMNQRTNSVLNPMKTTVSISTQNSFMLPEESTTMPSLQLIKDRRTTYQTPQTYFTPVSTIRSKTRLPKQTDSTPLRQNKTAKVPLPKDEKNLCKGTPADGMTVLQNGSLVVFRDHYFWNLNPFGIVTENPRRISDVWGVPSPIDTVFTRCNCDGKTFFFKGSHYWRFTNDIMDAGYPKQIVKGFGGLKEKVTAVLSVAAYKTRPESVYFFRSGLVQKYTYRQEPARKCSGGNHPIIQYPVYTYSNQPRKRQFEHKIVQYTRKARHLYADGSNNNGARTGILHEEIPIRSYWRGFPNSIVSAVSLPNPQKPDGYDYFVFSKEQYYNVNMSSRIAMKASPKKQQRTTKDWYKCTD